MEAMTEHLNTLKIQGLLFLTMSNIVELLRHLKIPMTLERGLVQSRTRYTIHEFIAIPLQIIQRRRP